MNLNELNDLNFMYQTYKDKKPIDKQNLITMLRREDSLGKKRPTYAELTSFIADCLDDKVRYIPKHNQKKLSHIAIRLLCSLIAEYTYKKMKSPRETAINEFAESYGYSARHVRSERKRMMSDADYEHYIAISIAWLIEDDKEKD